MLKYVKVMDEEELPPGKSAIISAGDDEIALFNYKGKYFAVAIKVLLHKPVSHEDLELFHTSIKNPIYEILTHKQAGSWEAMDGETLVDQAYNFGSQLKIWTWGKKKKKSKMEESS